MIHTKKIPKIEFEREVIDYETCDICKKKIKPKNNYDESFVNINAGIGENYPDGDCRTGYIISCCPDCFINKVRPLLEKEFFILFQELRLEDNRFENFQKDGK